MIEKTEKIIKKAAVTLFGEEFTLPVEYDVLGGESLLDSQKYALEMFLGKADELLNNSEVVKNYIENTKQIKVNDLFDELAPECIFVERNDNDRYTAVFLSVLDEDGKRTGDTVVIEFKNEEFYRVGDRSIVI